MAENFEVQVEAVAETSQKLAEVKEEKAKALTKAAEISVSAKESEVSDHIQEEKVVKGSDFNKLMEDLWKN